MAEYTYHRGSQNSREAVEFDITRRGQYITTCVVDVDLLICGIKAFPCGNGDDVKLTPEQQLAILETVQQERKRITDSYPVKTYEGWHESGLPTGDVCPNVLYGLFLYFFQLRLCELMLRHKLSGLEERGLCLRLNRAFCQREELSDFVFVVSCHVSLPPA